MSLSLSSSDTQDPQSPPPQGQEPVPVATQQPQGQEPKPAPAPTSEGAATAGRMQAFAEAANKAASQPLPPPAPINLIPPDFDEKLLRLLKAHADPLTQAVVDDRGRVLRQPMDPDEAMQHAISQMPLHMASGGAGGDVDAFRNYFLGGPIPVGWVPKAGTVKSTETQQLERQLQVGREESPVAAFFLDYLVDPLGNLVSAPLQVAADVTVGAGRLVHALPQDTQAPNIKNLAFASGPLAKATGKVVEMFGGPTTEDALGALAAYEATKSTPAKIVGTGAEFVGTAYGMTAGGVGKVLGVGGGVGAATGKALFGAGGKLAAKGLGATAETVAKVGEAAAKVGEAVGHGAGVFGTYEGLTAKEGERGKAFLTGAASGAAMGFAQGVTALALRGMFRTPINALGTEEKSTMQALTDWAKENKIFPSPGEAKNPFAYEKRVVDAYINAGLPNSPAMPVRKLAAYALKAGGDALGFSLLDQQFREDFTKAAWEGDKVAWNSMLAKFAGNFLGAGALHLGGLANIVPWQRRQAFQAPGFAADHPANPKPLPGQTTAATGPAAAPVPPGTPVEGPTEGPSPIRIPASREDTLAKLRQGIEQRLPPIMAPTVGEPVDVQHLYSGDWNLLWDRHPDTAGPLANLVPLGWRPSPKTVRDLPPAAAPDLKVQVGGNTVQQLLASRLVAENSALGRQLRDNPDGGEFTIPQSEADKFVDYYKRRAERKRDELGQSSVQSIDSFVEKLTGAKQSTPVARDFNLARGEAQKVSGPEGAPTPKPEPIGEPVTGTAPTTAEVRTGPSERKIKIELPGSGHSFTIDGENARPSPAMREALGLPAEMPTKDLVPLVEKASLVSALNAKATLPGQEVQVGVHGTAGRGEELPKMRRIAMGQLQESPLSPTPEWTDAAVAPNRGKDALEPDQHAAVEALRKLNNDKPDMPPEDRAMLLAATNVLDTASAANDPSIAETMKAMPDLTKAIENNEPGAVKALAESLTSKTPERAMADKNAAATEAAASAMTPENPIVQDMPEKMKARALSGEMSQREFNAYRKSLQKAEQARQRPGERGVLSFENDPNSPASRAADAVEAVARAAGTVLKRGVDLFQRSLIQAVEAAGRSDIANLGRRGVTYAKTFQSEADQAGLYDLRRMPHAQLDSMSELKRDENGGYADVFSRASDAGNAEHWGAVDLTPEQQAVVDKTDAVRRKMGEIAERVGVERIDSEGNRTPFKFDPNKRIQVREWTPEMREALRTKSGPLYDAITNWLQKTYGWTAKEADDHLTGGQALTTLDATEIARKIRAMPTHLDVAGRREPVRVMESRPREYAEQLARRSSNILGTRAVLPRFSGKPEKGAQSLQAPEGLEPLDPTAQQLVDNVLNQKGAGGGRDTAEKVARMVRAMQGMPLSAPLRFFRPGEPGYHVARIINNIFGVLKSAALTASFTQNPTEPLVNAAHFGTDTVGRAYKEALASFMEGRFAEQHRRAVEGGWIADSKLDHPTPDNAPETVEAWLKKAADILGTPMKLTQDMNEMTNFLAAEERLAAMKSGQGSAADRSALSLLGFSKPEAEAMLRGEGTPEQYDRYQKNIVGELAGGKSQRPAQLSRAAHSRTFNSLVWFTNFFQTRTRVLTQLANDIRANPQDPEKWTQFLKFAALTTAGGAIGNVLKQFILGGDQGASDYVREKLTGSPVQVGENFLSLFGNGIVGGLGQPIAQAWNTLSGPGATSENLGMALLREIGPLNTAFQVSDLAKSVLGMDVPGYENKDLLGKVAKYVQTITPAVRAANNGLFGMSALALSDKNPELDMAQKSYYRWVRENHPELLASAGGTDREAETRDFRDRMHGVIDKIAAGQTWDDDTLVNAVVDAEAAKMQANLAQGERRREQGGRGESSYQAYKDARESVAASIRSHIILKPGTFTTEERQQLEQHLGARHLQTLQDFNAVLESVAKRVSYASLRSRMEGQ